MKKARIHLLTILAGSLLALAIVFSQIFQPQSGQSKQVIKTEQQQDNSKQEQAYTSAPSFSLPSSAHVHLNIDVYCLFEILCQEKPQEIQDTESPLRPQKLMQTLFRVIIAPNAP
jgi:hypothetical protein